MADYAVVVTVRLVQSGENAGTPPVTAPALAESTGLSQSTVAKVLKVLSRAGIVTSVRGASGGYHLARRPDAITVRDVVAAIDGPLQVTECSTHVETCGRTAICSTRPHWGRINSAITAALDSVTLADMAHPGFVFAPPPAVASTSPASPESRPHDRLA